MTGEIIVDIGMRMLTPRERFSAQGFGSGYVIDRGQLEDGSIITLTLEQQGRMCGNSVCPGMARALVAANYAPMSDVSIRRPSDAPLFAAAE
jgi:DNA (cytosine-5)-methyltransferase 1